MPEQEKNERGNRVERLTHDGWRYDFDFGLCAPEKGWAQYDTDQDASYFGVWVHTERRQIFTFAEGDAISVRCGSDASFAAELRHMAEFYGDAPPVASVIDADGTLTEIYSDRPGVTA